ncbi:hypothetical protein CRM22_007180 [Opisthorchis felineus]|uniref:C2H2-type domain-containing protein n=1 Tax=Opisthorchis felineus TaxID=147828 RepID=A0A4S2LQD3_OPIFE|nr:hypothetical protein CRM22_007180 [Opisthorchis felineus]
MALQSAQWFEPSPKARKLAQDEEMSTNLLDQEHSDFQTSTHSDSASVKSDPEAPSNDGGPMDYEFVDDPGNKLSMNTSPKRSYVGPAKRLLKDSVASMLTPTSASTITQTSSANKSGSDDKRIRKFICRYCNKAFSLMNVLKVHERIHTGEKPYVCDICDKAFNQSGSLNRHKNTHMKRTSDNRSYSCHYCPRQFLHSSQLQDHETMEHGLPVSLKTSSPHQFDQPLNNIRDLRTRTTPQLQNTAGSSPMRPRNLSDSLNLVSETVTTSASTTPLGKLTSVANMFSKFESCPTSLLPLPAGLNLFHAVNKSSTMSNPEQHSKKTLQETELTNGAVTACTPLDGTFQCTLCPEMFVSRADLETHFGQHILQQIGLPVGNLSMHYPYSNKVSQHIDHLPNTGSNKTPMEEILLGVLQAAGKFPFPSTTVASSVASSQNAPCTEVTSALDPFKTLSMAANAANLFPNTAMAAALTTLSQLFMSAAVNGSSTTGNSGPVNNPTLLAEALSKSGILPSQKPSVPSQPLSTMGSAATLLDTASFEQLLKSVAAFGLPATAYSNFRNTINQASSTRSLVKDSCSSDLEEQGMNLTATQGIRSLVDATTPANSTTAPPAFTSNSLMGSIPTHPFPWLINPNIVTTPSVTGPYSQAFINSTKESPSHESFLPNELNHSVNKRSPSNYGTVNLNGLSVSESQDINATEGAALQSSVENSSTKSGQNTRQCDLCDKTFNCSSALRIHYRKHSGERPFKCSHCGAAFSQNGTLKRHLHTCKVALNRDDLGDSSQYNSSLEQSDGGAAVHSKSGTFARTENTDSDGSTEQDDSRIFRVSVTSKLTTTTSSETDINSYQMSGVDRSRQSFADKASQYSPSSSLSTDIAEPTTDRITNFTTTEEKVNEPHLNERGTESPPNYFTAHSLARLLKSITFDSSLMQVVLRYLQTADLLHGCLSCQTYFIDKQMLELHQKQMHSSSPNAKPFGCGVCGEDQQDCTNFLAHFLRSHIQTLPTNRTDCTHSEKQHLSPTETSFSEDSQEFGNSSNNFQNNQLFLTSKSDVSSPHKTPSLSLTNGYQAHHTDKDPEGNPDGCSDNRLSELYHEDCSDQVKRDTSNEYPVDKIKNTNTILTQL